MTTLAPDQQNILLGIARTALDTGCDQPCWLPEPDQLPEWCRTPGASFITLTQDGKLRGCIGTLNASRSIAEDVATNAHSAACHDPRFPPVTASERVSLHIEISILGKPEEISFKDRADLIAKLQPGSDGLIMESGHLRSTYLPSVWEQLSDPELFVASLLQKAGLPKDYWSEDIRFYRYTTQSFGTQHGDLS